MNRKVLLLADMEGCCGIRDFKNEESCQKKMIDEVAFVIKCIDSFANFTITVADCHNQGLTLRDFCEKNNICFVNHIWNLQDIGQYDLAFLVGFHGKANSKGWFSHTIRPDITNVFLGSRSVGEVSLLINYLAYYNVPVNFISGDYSISEELIGYKGEFWETKRVGELPKELDAQKDFIADVVGRALSHNNCAEYIQENILIDLKGKHTMNFIPPECAIKVKGKLYYENVNCFFSKLYSLCQYLNLASSYQDIRLKALCENIGEEERKKIISDSRGNFILFQKDCYELTDEEFEYLYGLIGDFQK